MCVLIYTYSIVSVCKTCTKAVDDRIFWRPLIHRVFISQEQQHLAHREKYRIWCPSFPNLSTDSRPYVLYMVLLSPLILVFCDIDHIFCYTKGKGIKGKHRNVPVNVSYMIISNLLEKHNVDMF